ncbi:hypothetical protein B0H14DRAFT_3607872 [Mycena olivaceomarginata]|nr:hypothetical protein B0H14DRAFT_3607872 [Mycena olivaceomarginata]
MCCAQFTHAVAGAMGISLNAKGDAKQDSEGERRGKKDGVLESISAVLTQRHDHECTLLAALQFLVAPIRTLPAELVEIYVLAVRDPSEFPEDPTHIFSPWRQVAIGTPRLWTGPIEISVDFHARPSDTYVDGIITRLERSAPLCADIHLSGPM